MADKKISQLTSGSPAQAADEYVVARSGANYKLTLTNIAASMPPIGATTPNTASFTTLTTSSTVTLNGGTANGVLYLNGSKVATSGSALVFDGTNLGLGVTPSTWGSEKAIQLAGSTFGDGVFASGNNIGVIVGANVNWDGSGYRYIDSAAISVIQFSAGQTRFYTSASGTAGASATLTQAMTLDASGNLGLGVTPSAWSTLTAFQVKNAAFAGYQNNTYIYANTYFDGSNVLYLILYSKIRSFSSLVSIGNKNRLYTRCVVV